MEPTTEVSARGHRRSLLFAYAVLIICGLQFLSIVVLRGMAASMDYGLVNILTLVIGFFVWLTLIFGLALLNVRFWVALLALPLVAVAALLAFYQFERVDSELIPRFRPRWTSAAAPRTETAADDSVPIDPSKFAPAADDFPQFLGVQRDAIVRYLRVNPDWNVSPPKIAWRQPIGNGWSSFAIQGDVAVTMEQQDQNECISAYDIADGRQLWIQKLPGIHSNVMGGTGPRATPTIHANRVYTQTATGKVVCLELSDGKPVWQVCLLAMAETTQAEFETGVAWGRSGSPLVVDDRLVIPVGGKPGNISTTLVALSLVNGTTLWRAGTDQISYSSPTLATIRGVRQILYVSENALAGHDIDSGKVLWSAAWPGSSSGDATASQPIPLDDTRILLSKGYSVGSKIVEIDRDQAGTWTTTLDSKANGNGLLKTKFTSSVVKDGFAYGLSDGILECVDTRDMRRRWKQGRYRHGHVLLINRHLLVTSEAGELVLVKASPAGFKEIAKMSVIGDVAWNTPALSGNRLLMRNSDEAACVLLPTIDERMAD